MARAVVVDHYFCFICYDWTICFSGAARISITSTAACMVGILFALKMDCAIAQQQTTTLAVSTAIAPTCAISNTNWILYFGELSRPGSATASFAFSCNSNFRFVFSSRHGGLVTYHIASVPSAFVYIVPYSLSYSIGTDQGFLVDVCSSSNMVGQASTCQGASASGAAAVNQTITLGFSWNLSGQYPVAGYYHDTLTFSVSAGL